MPRPGRDPADIGGCVPRNQTKPFKPPCPIHSQFRVVGHDLGGTTHRTCPLSDFEPPSTWLKGATWEIPAYISGDPVEWLEEHLSSRTRFIPAASPRVWPLTCGVSSCRVFGVSCGAQALGFGSPVLAFPLLHDPLPGPCRGSHRPPSRQPPKFQNRAFAALKGAMPYSRKTRRGRRVSGMAPACHDARSHIRQEGRAYA